jgi:hypothetical protein
MVNQDGIKNTSGDSVFSSAIILLSPIPDLSVPVHWLKQHREWIKISVAFLMQLNALPCLRSMELLLAFQPLIF